MTINVFNKVSTRDKSFFSNQLSLMLESGLQLSAGIRILKNQTTNQYFRTVLTEVLNDLEQGKRFSESLARFPGVFNRVYVNIVHSGESSGKLDNVLSELGSQLSQDSDFTSKLKNVMIYPVILLIGIVTVALFASVKLIPSLTEVFNESEVNLPWATQLLIGFSAFMLGNWLWLVIGIVVIVILLVYFLKTPTGEILVHQLLIREPTKLFLNLYLLRFCRIFGSLLNSGVPIIDSLQITSEVVGNDALREELRYSATQLEKGVPLSLPFSESKYFPYFLSQMLLVGEKTGKTDQILLNLAKYFEKETTMRIENLQTIFEPVIIVILGIAVAILVFAVILPVYQFAQVV